jgi:hypothetical protein
MLLISSCVPFKFPTAAPKYLNLLGMLISEADMMTLQDHIPGYGSLSPAVSSAGAAGPLLKTTSAVLILWPATHYAPTPLVDYVSHSPVLTLLAAFYQVYPRDRIYAW